MGRFRQKNPVRKLNSNSKDLRRVTRGRPTQRLATVESKIDVDNGGIRPLPAVKCARSEFVVDGLSHATRDFGRIFVNSKCRPAFEAVGTSDDHAHVTAERAGCNPRNASIPGSACRTKKGFASACKAITLLNSRVG